jgi:hypothetical protein
MNTNLLFRPAVIAAACALLVACGGGGGDAAPAGGGTPPQSDAAAQALAAGPALAPAPASLSGNVTCRNMAIGAIRLDSIDVPADAVCQLDGTVLIGNITVGRGAMLDAGGIATNGSVNAEGAAHVALFDASVGGSVQVKQGGSAQVEMLRITGDLQIDAMRGPVTASANAIGGSLQAVGNLGGLTITDNRINGNLQCKENQPAPVVAGNVAASTEDQCLPGSGSGGGGGSGGGNGGGVQPAPGSLSGNVTCDGLRIGAVSLDTVTVPAGASCVLEGTRLIGSIIVNAGATLVASDVRVNGNLQAEGAASTAVSGSSSFGGSVQVTQGVGASITGASIAGDLQVDAMRGPVTASANAIGGSLQAVGNRGGLSLSANRMGGNLQCKENLPAPTGSGNLAASKEDQCAAL